MSAKSTGIYIKLKRYLDFIFRLFPDKRFEMRNSAFFLNGGISHFFLAIDFVTPLRSLLEGVTFV